MNKFMLRVMPTLKGQGDYLGSNRLFTVSQGLGVTAAPLTPSFCPCSSSPAIFHLCHFKVLPRGGFKGLGSFATVWALGGRGGGVVLTWSLGDVSK